jgi:formate dehydrogenase assembly factor FdhD
MMATPRDVEDLAVGFALTEGVISGLGDIRASRPKSTRPGVASMWRFPASAWALIWRASAR